jgi:hypothetical protein
LSANFKQINIYVIGEWTGEGKLGK